jgi:hypothetical protein
VTNLTDERGTELRPAGLFQANTNKNIEKYILIGAVVLSYFLQQLPCLLFSSKLTLILILFSPASAQPPILIDPAQADETWLCWGQAIRYWAKWEPFPATQP